MFSSFRKFVVASGLLLGLTPFVVKAQTFMDMVEYRNAAFDYYFYTTRQNEQAALDSLDAWSRTGGSFKVAQQQQVGTVPLTRFFFSEIAKNRSRGSHFYASSDDERAALRALNPANSATARLPQDEGLFAHVYPAGLDSTAGECPVATSPVYRLFRGEPKFADDGNHRYVRKQDVYAEAISRGWMPEGIAFCAPDMSETSINLSASLVSPAVDVVLKPNVLALATAVYSLPNRLTLPTGSAPLAEGQLLLVGDRSFRVTAMVSTAEAVYAVARVRPDQIYSSLQIRAGAISAATATFQVNPALQDHLKASLCANISRRPGDDVALQNGGFPQVDACFLRENARRDPAKMRTGFSIGVSKLKHGDAVISGEIALLIQDDPIRLKADLLKALLSGEDAIESADIDFVLTGRAKFAAEIGRSISAVPGSGIQPTELNAPLGHIAIGLGYGIVFRVPVYLVVDTAKMDIKGTLHFDAELDVGIKMSYGLLPSGAKGWRQVPPLSVDLVSSASNESTVAFFDASVDASAKLRAGIAATPMLTVIGMSDYLHLGLDLRLLPRLEAAARLTTKNPPLCTDYGFGLDFVARVVGQFGVWDGKIDVYDKPIGNFGREMNIKQKCGDAVSVPAGPRIVKQISPLNAQRGQAKRITIDLSRADVEDIFSPPRLFIGSQACELDRTFGFAGGSASFVCTLNDVGSFGAKVYLGTSFLAANGDGASFLVNLNPQVQSVVPVSIAEVSKVLTFSVTGKDLSDNTLLRMDNCEQTVSLGGTSTERRFSCVPARSGRQPVVVFESLNGTPLRYSEVVVGSQTLATRTAQISDLQPREARQNEVSRFTVTGTDLDAGVSLTINTCGNANRRTVSPTNVEFECVVTGPSAQRFDVLNNLGQSKLSGFVNVRLPSPVNRAPSVGVPDYSRNISVGSPFTGTFRSVDPDGDRMINQRVTVTRASDGGTCKIDVGTAGVPQIAGDKVFSGCSTLATAAGSYELRADGSDYLSTTASAGLSATPASGYIVQVSSTPGAPYDGVCGTADRTTVATIPTANLCSVGTTTGATGTGPWAWTCQGTGGGTNAPCSAQKTPTANQPPAVPSATATFDAGRSVTLTFVVTDPEGVSVSADAYLSSAGGGVPYNLASKKTSAAGASGTTRTLTWTAAEIASLTTVGQTYTIRIDAFDNAGNKTEKVTNSFIVTASAVNGVCGTADRTTVATIPTANLCSVGTTSGVTGTGPWAWTCQGTSGGTNAPCSAQKTAVSSVPPTITNFTFTFDAVANEFAGLFSVTDPDTTLFNSISVRIERNTDARSCSIDLGRTAGSSTSFRGCNSILDGFSKFLAWATVVDDKGLSTTVGPISIGPFLNSAGIVISAPSQIQSDAPWAISVTLPQDATSVKLNTISNGAQTMLGSGKNWTLTTSLHAVATTLQTYFIEISRPGDNGQTLTVNGNVTVVVPIVAVTLTPVFASSVQAFAAMNISVSTSSPSARVTLLAPWLTATASELALSPAVPANATNTSFSTSLTPRVAAGTYSMTFRAYDVNNQMTAEQIRPVVVTQPAFSIIIVNLPTTLAFNEQQPWDANVQPGVPRLAVFEGSILVAESVLAGQTFPVQTSNHHFVTGFATAGVHNLELRAYDSSGTVVATKAATVTVTAPATFTVTAAVPASIVRGATFTVKGVAGNTSASNVILKFSGNCGLAWVYLAKQADNITWQVTKQVTLAQTCPWVLEAKDGQSNLLHTSSGTLTITPDAAAPAVTFVDWQNSGTAKPVTGQALNVGININGYASRVQLTFNQNGASYEMGNSLYPSISEPSQRWSYSAAAIYPGAGWTLKIYDANGVLAQTVTGS